MKITREIMAAGIALLFSPAVAWTGFAWSFAAADERDEIFKHGSAWDRATNVMFSVLGVGGVVFGLLMLMFMFALVAFIVFWGEDDDA